MHDAAIPRPQLVQSRLRRTAGDKFQELAQRSPKDLAALVTLADLILARLDADDRKDRP